jgi:hypothetical protein
MQHELGSRMESRVVGRSLPATRTEQAAVVETTVEAI